MQLITGRPVYSVTRSVAIKFGQHGMPPPASNATDTAFCFLN